MQPHHPFSSKAAVACVLLLATTTSVFAATPGTTAVNPLDGYAITYNPPPAAAAPPPPPPPNTAATAPLDMNIKAVEGLFSGTPVSSDSGISDDSALSLPTDAAPWTPGDTSSPPPSSALASSPAGNAGNDANADSIAPIPDTLAAAVAPSGMLMGSGSPGMGSPMPSPPPLPPPILGAQGGGMPGPRPIMAPGAAGMPPHGTMGVPPMLDDDCEEWVDEDCEEWEDVGLEDCDDDELPPDCDEWAYADEADDCEEWAYDDQDDCEEWAYDDGPVPYAAAGGGSPLRAALAAFNGVGPSSGSMAPVGMMPGARIAMSDGATLNGMDAMLPSTAAPAPQLVNPGRASRWN